MRVKGLKQQGHERRGFSQQKTALDLTFTPATSLFSLLLFVLILL